jgi:hypothetical protein
MWDLWWTKWHWDRFFPEYFGFPLSISFHRCSIKMEKQKKTSSSASEVCTINLQGCGASVASAAGPFSKIIIIVNSKHWHVTNNKSPCIIYVYRFAVTKLCNACKSDMWRCAAFLRNVEDELQPASIESSNCMKFL